MYIFFGYVAFVCVFCITQNSFLRKCSVNNSKFLLRVQCSNSNYLRGPYFWKILSRAHNAILLKQSTRDYKKHSRKQRLRAKTRQKTQFSTLLIWRDKVSYFWINFFTLVPEGFVEIRKFAGILTNLALIKTAKERLASSDFSRGFKVSIWICFFLNKFQRYSWYAFYVGRVWAWSQSINTMHKIKNKECLVTLGNYAQLIQTRPEYLFY